MKFSPIGLVVIIILTIVILWVSQWYGDYIYNKKYPTKESVVEAYLNFSVKGDKKSLMSIAPPNNMLIDKDIDSKIKQYEGKKIENLQVRYSETLGNHLWIIYIEEFRADSTGGEINFQDKISVEYAGRWSTPPFQRHPSGRWFVILGTHDNNKVPSGFY